jgi:response regulator NasT
MRIMHIKTGGLNSETLVQTLREHGHDIVANIDAADDIYSICLDNGVDVIVADLKHPDARLLEQFSRITHYKPVPMVIFSESGDDALIEASIKAGVNAFVVDGMEPQRIHPIITAAVVRFRETQTLRQDLDKTRAQLQERKIIERAKGILMQSRGWSEDQAYQSMRKLAMSQNKRLPQIAEAVISAAELIG